MSAFDRFVIWARHAVWYLRLLLLLAVLVVPILRLIVVILIHSVHIAVRHIVAAVVAATVAAAITAHVLTSSAEALEAALILHSTSAKALVATSSLWSSSPVLLVCLSRSLVAILVLNTLLSQLELLRREWITWLSEFLVTVGEVALVF